MKKLKDLHKIKTDDLTKEQKAEIANLEELTSMSGSKGRQEAKDFFDVSVQNPVDFIKSTASTLANSIQSAVSNGLREIDDTISSFYVAQGSIEARLQGSGESYKKMTKLVSNAIGLSGYVSQKKVPMPLTELFLDLFVYNKLTQLKLD